jgi:hypothetical protein
MLTSGMDQVLGSRSVPYTTQPKHVSGCNAINWIPWMVTFMLVGWNGILLAVRLSSTNDHDATQLRPLADAIPPIIGPRVKPGRARKRPAKLHADKAYGSAEPPRAVRPKHYPAHCPARRRFLRTAGAAPMGCRALTRLAALLPSPWRPL